MLKKTTKLVNDDSKQNTTIILYFFYFIIYNKVNTIYSIHESYIYIYDLLNHFDLAN